MFQLKQTEPFVQKKSACNLPKTNVHHTVIATCGVPYLQLCCATQFATLFVLLIRSRFRFGLRIKSMRGLIDAGALPAVLAITQQPDASEGLLAASVAALFKLSGSADFPRAWSCLHALSRLATGIDSRTEVTQDCIDLLDLANKTEHHRSLIDANAISVLTGLRTRGSQTQAACVSRALCMLGANEVCTRAMVEEGGVELVHSFVQFQTCQSSFVQACVYISIQCLQAQWRMDWCVCIRRPHVHAYGSGMFRLLRCC